MKFKTTSIDQHLTITMTTAQCSWLIGVLNAVQKTAGLDVSRQMVEFMDVLEAHEPVAEEPTADGQPHEGSVVQLQAAE